MTNNVDVETYLSRIGYRGPRDPSLETLRELQRRHVETVPFETLAMLVGDRVRLDLVSLQNKILLSGRGGYCFELNLLFFHLLRALGFDARVLTGRVTMHGPEEAATARTHVLLLVTLGGVRYTVDVGFGGMTPTAPLMLDTEDEQPTPHETYRLTNRAGAYTLRARVGDEWRHYYLFDLAPPLEIDLEVGNWYVSTHPDSPFRGRLLAARAEPGVRHALRGAEYTRHEVGVSSERRRIETPEEATVLLRDVFRIEVPDTKALRSGLLAAICEPTQPPPVPTP